MGDKPEDKNIKGFAGFESFSDDLTVEIPETADTAAPKNAESTEEKSKPKSTKSPQSGGYLKRKIRTFKYKAAENKSWWVIGGAALVFMLIAMNEKPHPRNTSYTPSTTSSYNTTIETETKPAAGTNNVLSYAELRYCFAEKVRMDAIEPAVNLYVQEEVDKFNALVSDYNIRCGQFRYRKNDYASAERYVENNRAAIVQEGLDRLKSWRPSAAPQSSNTQPSATNYSWYKPATIQGIYHRSTFTNCCINGKESQDAYNDLELLETADIIGGTNPLRGVKHIQIGIKSDQLLGISEGDKVTVECKSLWEGNTGHYALPVYCDASSVKSAKVASAPVGNDAQAILNQKVAAATGLVISRVDKFGNEQPTTGGYIADTKFLVKLNDKIVFDGEGAAYMNFKHIDKIKDENVVLLETNNGGNACPSESTLISVTAGNVNLVRPFGNCSEPEISYPAKNQIKYTFFSEYGERLVATYKNQQLAESKIKLPLHHDAEGDKGGAYYLLKYLKENDVEKVLLDSNLNPALKIMMGDDFEKLKPRLMVFSPAGIKDDFIIMSGCLPHSCGSDGGFLAIALDGSAIYVAVLESIYITQTKTSTSYIRAYSSAPAISSTPPAAMNEWLAEFKNVRANWTYASNQQSNEN